VVALVWPLMIAVPVSVMVAWVAIALFTRAYSLRRARRASGQPTMKEERKAGANPATDTAGPRG